MVKRAPVGWLMLLGLVTGFAPWGAGEVRAADPETPEIQMQRKLDEPLTLSLQGVAISEAFKQIAAAAKIQLQVDPACYELLPYGETTRVSVDFKQSKLREAMDVLLVPVGLQTSIVGGVLMIRPSSPLQHIGHRADWEELKLLKDLWSSPDLKVPANGTFNLVDAIRAAMESAIVSRKDIQVVLPVDAAGALSPAHFHAIDQISHQLPMSAYRALEMYCQLTGNIWYVEAGDLAGGATGGRVVISTQRKWIERQLAKPIQISRTREALEVVVSDLSHASGIQFVPEPGLYQVVPVISLKSDNATVRQTLETLAGMTRIAFDIREDSILLHMAAGSDMAAPKQDVVVGRISVPVGPEGAMMDVYIKESDLTLEQNELRRRKIEEAVKAMQKAWTMPAASGPASKPE